MTLPGELEAIVLDGARTVPEETRDKYFERVAKACRLFGATASPSALRRAVNIAISQCIAECAECAPS